MILSLAIANGAFREAFLLPWLGRALAQGVSGTLLCLFILGVSYWLVPRLHAGSPFELLRVGVFWLTLTVAFELGFGHFVQGRAWSELGEAYTFQGGNLWPVILLVTLLAPLLVGRRGLPKGGRG